MTPENSELSEKLYQLYSQLYETQVIPSLEQYAASPPSQDAISVIRQWIKEGFSLPRSIAHAITQEAEYFEKFYIENFFRHYPEIPEPPDELSISTLYAYAPECIGIVEEHLSSEGIVEEGLSASIDRYGAEMVLMGDQPEVAAAEGHILLNRWALSLRGDPSGFAFVDAIASGELPSQLTYSIIKPHEMPFVRLIELGSERYKRIHTAISEQITLEP